MSKKLSSILIISMFIFELFAMLLISSPSVSAAAPTVTTNDATGVEETNATLNGNLVNSSDTISGTFEYYNTSDNNQYGIGGTVWGAQTFTPGTINANVFDNITGVKLKLYRSGDIGTVTVSIRATASSKPTGGDLISATFDGNTLSQNNSGEWKQINFSSSYSLICGTQYAIVIRSTNITFQIRMHTTGTYTGGTFLHSSNSGGSWTIDTNYDGMFEEIGNSFAAIVNFQYGTTTGYGTNSSSQIKPNGTAFSTNILSLSQGTFYHYRSSANNSNGTSYGSDKTFLTKPNEPTNLAISNSYENTLNLTWTKGTGANNTYIERNATGVTTPWAMGTGTNIYNGTLAYYNNTGLTPGTTYYYQLWSYSAFDTEYQWSDANTSGNKIATGFPTVTTNASTLVEETTATLNGYLNNDGGYWVNVCDAFFQYGLTTGYGNEKFVNDVYSVGTTGIAYSYQKSNMGDISHTAAYGAKCGAITEDSTYIYIGGNTVQKVYKYWKSNMTKAGETAAYGGNIYAIAVDDTYIYVGGAITLTVRKYLKSDMSYIGQTASYGGNINSIVLDSTYIYVGGATTNRVRKYLKSDLSYVTQSASYGGEIANVRIDDTYVYVCGATANVVSKYLKSDLSFIISSASYGGGMVGLAIDNDYVYAGGASSRKVYKYQKSDLTNVAETVAYGGTIRSIVVCGEYVYYGGDTTGRVRQVYRSNLTQRAESENYQGIFCISTMNSSTGETNKSITGLSQGTFYHYRSSATNNIGTSYGADQTFLTKPNEPTGLTIVNGDSKNSLSWTHGIGYNRSVLIAKIGSYPTDMYDGAEIYNNTGNSYLHSGLTPGDTWYYRVWEYAEDGGLFQFSDVYAQGFDQVITIPNVTTNASTPVEETTATLNGYLITNGFDTTTCGFWYDIDSGSPYANNQSIGVKASNTEFNYAASSLTRGELYYFKAWAYNTLGFVSNGEETFLTKPNEPTGLSITNIYANNTQYLTWTHGIGYNRSVARVDTTGYPATPTSGTEAYNGTNNNFYYSTTPGQIYYYRIWEYAEESGLFQFSDTYSQAVNLTEPNPPTAVNIYNNIIVNQLHLTWTKGTGANNTYIERNTTATWTLGEGTEVYNGTLAYYNNTGLTQGTTYYYQLWSYNESGGYYKYSPAYASCNKIALDTPETTTDDATNVEETTATLNGILTDNGGETCTVNFSWGTTKTWGTYTANQYKTTGQTFFQNLIGLTQGQAYFYTTYANNSEWAGGATLPFGSYDHAFLMKPEVLTNTNLELYNATHLYLSWTKGTGANNTVVIKKTTGVPSSVTDGTEAYNGTASSCYIPFTIGETSYYKAWSYSEWTDPELYQYSDSGTEFSNSTGLIVDAFSEDDCSQITGYSIIVSNEDGSDVYVLNNITGAIAINASLCPQGEVSILVSKDGYRNRLYYLTIEPGLFYYINTYLPLNTTSELYMITVVGDKNEYGNSPPVEHALVTIKTYMNCTGQYETITNLYTDASGQCDLYLRSTLYKVTMEKTGYYTNSEDYIPNVELRTRTFRLSVQPAGEEPIDYLFKNITYEIYPTGQIHYGSFTIWWNITSSDNQLEWYSLEVTKYNSTTGLWDQIFYQNDTNPGGGSINYTVANVTGRYAAEFWFKKIGFDPYKMIEIGSIQYSIEQIKEALISIPDYAYFIAVLVIMALIMGFAMPYAGVGTGYIGLIIFAIALLLKPFSIVVGHDPGDTVSGWWIWGVTFLMYSIGIFLWSRL
jgi:hypothetical protein